MRQRLVAAFVGLTILVIALYGIPRAYFLADLIRSQEQTQVDQLAHVAAVAVDQRTAAGGTADAKFLEMLVRGDDKIAITRKDLRPGADDLHASETLADGSTLMVSRDSKVVDDDIAQALLPLVLVGLALVVLAGAVAVGIAQRLARPFQELARAAGTLGTGDPLPETPTYRVPEAQAISEALSSGNARLNALLENEREVATVASHELRTPLTVLRLELEDLAQWPETDPKVRAELHRATESIDRLSAAITALLDRAKDRRADGAIDLDLDALVADTAAALVAEGRDVVHTGAGVLPTSLDPAPLVQALALLTGEAPPDRTLRLETHDQGSHYEVRMSTTAATAQTWNRAGELLASVGGHLSRHDGTGVLRLPKRPLGVGGTEQADQEDSP